MPIDIETGIYDAFAKFGSSDAQKEDAALVLKRECEIVGDVLVLKATRAALESPESKAWLEKQKPHLLPAKYERSLADRAFAENNLTARGQLVREIGMAEADKLAQTYGLKSASDPRRGKRPEGADDHGKPNGKDRRSNPWSREAWNVSEQGRLVRALGVDKAAAIAASAGCKIGSTRPAD